MKKLINDPRHLVRELLEGTVDLSPDLALLEGEDVVVRRDLPPAAERKVAVLSGGGSGHEPAHAGYVGRGMLTAAIAGDVFTSPSTDAVLAAILAVSGPAGALLVVKNYTGDRLNFGLAAELAGSRESRSKWWSSRTTCRCGSWSSPSVGAVSPARCSCTSSLVLPQSVACR
jgi:dihydroxyacetone kinase